mgnify:FL=1
MSINALSMSAAASSSTSTIDTEYQRIMRQLRAYGVEPTGDKSVDKAKLQKIEAAEQSQKTQSAKADNDTNKKNSQDSSNSAAQSSAGTDQLAMLNKIRLGLI